MRYTIASLNARKRLGSPDAFAKVKGWLEGIAPHVLLVQEPVANMNRMPQSIGSYESTGGNLRVSTWSLPAVNVYSQMMAEYWQASTVGSLTVHNIYLDAYSRGRRAEQLRGVHRVLRESEGKYHILIGDFNIAPNRWDGLYDGRPSTFNGEADRTALREVIRDLRMVDLTPTTPWPYTVDRTVRGRRVLFRCDLVLVTQKLAESARLTYDSQTRASDTGFSDHSGLIIEVDDTVENSLWPESIDADTKYMPHNTAIPRQRPSTVARLVQEVLAKELDVRSVLDYGCGYGADVEFYRSFGLEAEGFDPHPGFGWPPTATKDFDLVVLAFVLNVLPDSVSRLEVLRAARAYVRPGKYLLVATRSEREIASAAARRQWPRHGDGYWSNRARGMFQHGMTTSEVRALALEADLASFDEVPTPRFAGTLVVMRRRL